LTPVQRFKSASAFPERSKAESPVKASSLSAFSPWRSLGWASIVGGSLASQRTSGDLGFSRVERGELRVLQASCSSLEIAGGGGGRACRGIKFNMSSPLHSLAAYAGRVTFSGILEASLRRLKGVLRAIALTLPICNVYFKALPVFTVGSLNVYVLALNGLYEGLALTKPLLVSPRL